MSLARREMSPARLGRNLRLLLARRPWLRWLAVGADRRRRRHRRTHPMQSLDTARARWSDQRRVPVATTETSPGEAISWEWRSLPAVAVPTDVAADISAGALARQHIGVGEIVVSADLTIGAGPAAGARPEPRRRAGCRPARRRRGGRTRRRDLQRGAHARRQRTDRPRRGRRRVRRGARCRSAVGGGGRPDPPSIGGLSRTTVISVRSRALRCDSTSPKSPRCRQHTSTGDLR